MGSRRATSFHRAPFILQPGKPDAAALRAAYAAGRFGGMGEIATQLTGVPPNDPALEPYFALAEERDLPVLIHTLGIGPYDYLEALVRAGLGKRVTFGSDQMRWPDKIGEAIKAIDQAPFLTEEQKRDILYHNAVRFLRLEQEPA